MRGISIAAVLVAAGLVTTLSADVTLYKTPQPAPPLHLTALDGTTISLAQLRGKVVLLNFWATWCGPCRMEIPELERLQRDYAGKLQIVGLAVDDPQEEGPNTAGRVRMTALRFQMNYPVAMANQAVQDSFGGTAAIPTTLVIDQQGEIVMRHIGANPYSVFAGEVRALLHLPIEGRLIRMDPVPGGAKVRTTQIPGLVEAFGKLTPAQRKSALAKLNAQMCDCGCGMSLAACRVEDQACSISLRRALKVIADEAGPPAAGK
jgi:thiol-disulfide isomerase/thioredoxin